MLIEDSLHGLICPIYGYGALLVSILLKKYQNDIIITFLMSIIICGLLEYFTSYFMELFFHARWWDYSDRKLNINGRVCLDNLVLFGIASLIIIYLVNPFIIQKINLIPSNIQVIIITILLIVHIIDNIISFKIIINLKQVSNEIRDNTIEISEKVKNIIHSKSFLHRRLINAFPNIKGKVGLKQWPIKKNKNKKY